MNFSFRANVALAGVAAIALSGCVGGVQSVPSTSEPMSSAVRQQISLARIDPLPAPIPAHPFVRTRTKPFAGVVWVTDAKADQVFKCNPSGCTAVGSGWSLPQGIAVDGKGYVYVADSDNSRIVKLDKNGNTVSVLSDPGEYPAGVDVARDGTVGVTNILSVYDTAGNIVFYARGATTPTRTASGVLSKFYYGAFDSKGRFFNDGITETGAVNVCFVPPGGTTNFNTGIVGPYSPGGVEVIPGKVFGTGVKEALVIDDQELLTAQNFNLSYYYQLISTTHFYPYSSDPVSIAFPRGDGVVWTADAGTQSANMIAYPAGGAPTYQIGGFTEPIGVVAVPSGE